VLKTVRGRNLFGGSLTSGATLQYCVPRGWGHNPCRLKCVEAKFEGASWRHSDLSPCRSQNAGSQPIARTCVACVPALTEE